MNTETNETNEKVIEIIDEHKMQLSYILNDTFAARLTILKTRQLLDRGEHEICGFILYNKTTGERVTVDMGNVQWYNNVDIDKS